MISFESFSGGQRPSQDSVVTFLTCVLRFSWAELVSPGFGYLLAGMAALGFIHVCYIILLVHLRNPFRRRFSFHNTILPYSSVILLPPFIFLHLSNLKTSHAALYPVSGACSCSYRVRLPLPLPSTQLTLHSTAHRKPKPSDCTTTITYFPPFQNLATTTVYGTTITKKSEVDCNGCKHVTEIPRREGPGPVRFLPKFVYMRRAGLVSFRSHETDPHEM